jgi:Family of unknown function (DUF6481)
MSGFKDDFNERLDAAAKAKQAMLEKFRARQRPAAPGADAPDVAAPESPADEPGEGGGKAGRKAGNARK